MDDHDQDALGQVHKADQERVPEGIFYSVVKSGQNRENIKAGQQQEEGYDKQHRLHCFLSSSPVSPSSPLR